MSIAVRRFKPGDRVRMSGLTSPVAPLKDATLARMKGASGEIRELITGTRSIYDYSVSWDRIGPKGPALVFDIELSPEGPIDYATQDEGGVV